MIRPVTTPPHIPEGKILQMEEIPRAWQLRNNGKSDLYPDSHFTMRQPEGGAYTVVRWPLARWEEVKSAAPNRTEAASIIQRAVRARQAKVEPGSALSTKRILICAMPLSGLGDLMGAHALLQALVPYVPASQLGLVMESNQYENEARSLMQEGASQYLPMTDAASHAAIRNFNPDAIIAFPFDGGFVSVLTTLRNIVPNARMLRLREYGYYAGEGNFSLGIGAQEQGLLISHELRQYAIASRAYSAAQRLRALVAVREPIVNAILGGHTVTDESLAAFAQNTNLHMGYAARGRTALWFAAVLVEMMRLRISSNEVCLILPGMRGKLTYANMPDGYEADIAKLISNSDVEILTVRIKPPRTDAATTVRIILTHRLPHREVLALKKAAEPIGVLSTGDQSFSEEVSMRRLFCYEALSHKSTIMHDFIAAAPIALQRDVRNLVATTESSYMESPQSAAKSLVALSTGACHQQWLSFMDDIAEHHDCSASVLRLLCAKLRVPFPVAAHLGELKKMGGLGRGAIT